MCTKNKMILGLSLIVLFIGFFFLYNLGELKIFASVFESDKDKFITHTSYDASSENKNQSQFNESTFFEIQSVEEKRAILQKESETVVNNIEEASEGKANHAVNKNPVPKEENKSQVVEKSDSQTDKNKDVIHKAPKANEENKKEEKQAKENQKLAHQLLEIEREVIRLTNVEREKHGLLPLETDFTLSYVAREKSEDMVVNQYFAHESPTYGTPFQMLDKFGVYYTYAGENLAYGFSFPEQVLSAWMESEGHRKNILNKVYTHIGVGYHPNGHYWTMLLIRK